MSARRLSVRDRYFAGTEVVKIVGPVAAPSADAVRGILADMHADRPHAKAFSRLDAAGGRWRPIAGDRFRDWAQDLVVDLAGEEDPDKTTVRMLAEPMGQRPVLVGTGGTYPSIRFNHAVGDAAFINPFFIGALTAAATGHGARYPLPPSTRLPLLRAALHHFARHPGRLVTAAKFSRAPREAASPSKPWAPAMVYQAARSEPGAARRLRKWRDSHAPGASLGAVLSAAASAAVRRHLPAPAQDGLFMLFDARRYLPRGRIVDGNFVVGEYVPTTDPADVRAIHETVASRVRAGRSLAVLAVHHAGLVRAGRRAEPVPPSSVPPSPHPRLALSYLGRADTYADLPWLADYPDRTMMSVAAPGGPEAITMAIEEFGDVLHATTTYHENVFDPAAVAAATAALVGDPERLLHQERPMPAAQP
jgi:hypothetical protein